MGYKTLHLTLPTDYSDDDIKKIIHSECGDPDFTYQIEKKSLDARHKNSIHWQITVVVFSRHFPGENYEAPQSLTLSCKKRTQKVVVVGSGPAGFFAALVLQLSGFQVTIIERGSEVGERKKAIVNLESTGEFSPQNNYAFGEGGAGTFSDGKLTSRSKHISSERHFILSEYIKAGAPEEIGYMAHPHVGTDNLEKIVVALRMRFLENGGRILFDTRMTGIIKKGSLVQSVLCDSEEIEADYVVIATGHSAYDTYRILMNEGVIFGTKNFAIGHRIEHPQNLINTSQWGRESLPGVKAAEYRLATQSTSGVPVYTFCMCPGGYVVPAAAFEEKSVVNGMSFYLRDNRFANAGCVAGVHPDMLLGHTSGPVEILDWMDTLEEQFYNFSGSLVIPGLRAEDYMKRKNSKPLDPGSYPLGVKPAPLFSMVPEIVSKAIAEGLYDFSRKIKGFETGTLMGLENKTSSPLRVSREKNGKCSGFDNLYFVGEGSGYAGGIISSAADGVKCAMAISSG
ncbi:MAG: NAD(P)/FAD-dependent oxidoreductase [Spirochaetales bacterium]|nr:NAD(P)/FAD-dependent oxidoreductase [Spirochaetales bacterium]